MIETETAPSRPASITQPDVRERILDCLERQFRTHGYQRVTVADIARELGMSPANVYRFFDSKASLREALAARLTAQVEESCRAVAMRPGKPSERLRAMITEWHRMTIERYVSAENMSEVLQAAMRENSRVIDAHTARQCALFAQLMAEGNACGEFRVKDPVLASRILLYTLSVFVDPSDAARLFKDDEMVQVSSMCDFILGSLRSGGV